MFSPKCAPNDPLGFAGHLRTMTRRHSTMGNALIPAVIAVFHQVTNCLGVVFVHSDIQITPKVKLDGGWGGGGGGGGGWWGAKPLYRPLTVTPADESILESLP